MAFLDVLCEMLSRQQVTDLAQVVAVVSIEKQREKNPRMFLNLNFAKEGQVEWEEYGPGVVAMKGKIVRDILPKVKDQLGAITFMSKNELEDNTGVGYGQSITRDEPVRLARM